MDNEQQKVDGAEVERLINKKDRDYKSRNRLRGTHFLRLLVCLSYCTYHEAAIKSIIQIAMVLIFPNVTLDTKQIGRDRGNVVPILSYVLEWDRFS